jgi:hypothetical protein
VSLHGQRRRIVKQESLTDEEKGELGFRWVLTLECGHRLRRRIWRGGDKVHCEKCPRIGVRPESSR